MNNKNIETFNEIKKIIDISNIEISVKKSCIRDIEFEKMTHDIFYIDYFDAIKLKKYEVK